VYNNIILRNFDFSNNFLKLVLKAGSASKTPLLLTIFNQYNFSGFNDFFDKFNNLTSFLSKDILLPIILYIPDTLSYNNSFLFYIKSPNSFFLLRKTLFLNLQTKLNLFYFINILDLFKIAILKSVVLSTLDNIKFIFYFKYIKSIFFSLKGCLNSIQSLNINNSIFSRKFFYINLYI